MSKKINSSEGVLPKINEALRPAIGWTFVDKGVSFFGDSIEELSNNVVRYRLSTGVPVGEPEKEITAYLLSQRPWLLLK